MNKLEKASFVCSCLAAVLLLRNLYVIFLVLPDEAAQGAIYRLLFFHVPAWWTAFVAVGASATSSILYLVTKRLKFDSICVAVTEVGVTFLLIGMLLGSIWGRNIWGIWWTWDPRLTSAFVCVLLYSGYFILRRSIPDVSLRARLSSVYSIFAFTDVPIVWYSIRWWRTQHPQPMNLPPDMMSALLWNWLAMGLVAISLVLIRVQQETTKRRIDSIRLELREAS